VNGEGASQPTDTKIIIKILRSMIFFIYYLINI
jgi:hypothetical protein